MENDDYDFPVQIICSDKNSLHLPKSYLLRLSEFSQQLSENIKHQLIKNVNNKALMLDFCDIEELTLFAEIFLTSKDFAHELLPDDDFYDDALEMVLNLSSKFDSDQLLITCANYALRLLKLSTFNCEKVSTFVDLLSNLKRRNMDSIFRRFYVRLYSEFCIWFSYDFDTFSDNNKGSEILLSKNFDQIYRLKYRALQFCTKVQNRFRHDYCRMQYVCKFDPFCQSFGLKCVKCDDFVCRMCGNGEKEAKTSNIENDDQTCKKCHQSVLDCSCIKYGTIACEFCTICQQNFIFCRCDELQIEKDDEDFSLFFAAFLVEN
uniref:Uncharacterized protein n=1 Tax=Romanomermis culicivorax TaxID=13658 RepID=A0A915JB13_ROMCU